MKYIFLLLIFAALWLPSSAAAQNRGDAISVELLEIRSPETIAAQVTAFASDFPADLIGSLVPTRYEVAGLRVVYHAIDGRGNPTVASGFIGVPIESNERSPLAVYHHGTFTEDARAPSNLGFESILGFAYASDGYVALLLDYLGLGAGCGFNSGETAETSPSWNA